MTDDATALIALTTAVLNGSDLEAVIERVLATEDEPVADFAFRDRSRVRRAAKLAASLLPPERPLLGQSTGPAGRWTRRTAAPRRAAYVLAAARRLAVAEPDVKAERRYLAQHIAAERGRAEAAADIDRKMLTLGPILGWYAKQDDITDAECAARHGGNFNPANPPRLDDGWPVMPGTVHPTCRCVAGPPFPQGRLL